MALEEMKREEEMMADFEDSVNSVHEAHLNGLMVTRMQSGARMGMAKGTARKRRETRQIANADKEVQGRFKAAAKIQALTRGVIARKKHAYRLPTLQKEMRARSYCTECENKKARRRCRQCKDNFCEACYDKIHKRGMSSATSPRIFHVYIHSL